MKALVRSIVCLLFSLHLCADTQKFPDMTDAWIQNGCAIFNFQREIKHYPGKICIFLDDGSFISATDVALKRFSPDKAVLWERSFNTHHQVNLSQDKTRILALSSEVVKRNNRLERDDLLLVLDLNGTILHQMSGQEFLKFANEKSVDWKMNPGTFPVEVDLETTHANSFYEVPENDRDGKVPWLKKGILIVNSLRFGIFFISPDLKTILHRILLPTSHFHNVHDVQVTKEGNLLFFNNWVSNKEFIRYSAIQIYDPVAGKLILDFTSTPKEMFYSYMCGGVQEIGDFLFFNHVSGTGYFYSKSKSKLTLAIPGFNGDPRSSQVTQQLKYVNLKSFLKNSK